MKKLDLCSRNIPVHAQRCVKDMDQHSPALRMRRRIPHPGPWHIVEDQNPLVLHLKRGPRHTPKGKNQRPPKLEAGRPSSKLVLMEPFEPGFAVCKMLYVEVPASPSCCPTGSSRETTSHTTPSSPLSSSSLSSSTSTHSSNSSTTDMSFPDLTPLPPLSPLPPATFPLPILLAPTLNPGVSNSSGVSASRPAWMEKLQVLMQRAEQLRSGSRKRPLEEPEGAPPRKRSFFDSFSPSCSSTANISVPDLTPLPPLIPLPPITSPLHSPPTPEPLIFSSTPGSCPPYPRCSTPIFSSSDPSSPPVMTVPPSSNHFSSPPSPQSPPHTTEPFFPTDLSFSDSDSDSDTDCDSDSDYDPDSDSEYDPDSDTDSDLTYFPPPINPSSPAKSPLPPQAPTRTTEPFFPTDLSFSDSDSDSDLPSSCTPLSKSSPAKSPLPPQNPPHTTEPFFPTDLSFSDSDSDSDCDSDYDPDSDSEYDPDSETDSDLTFFPPPINPSSPAKSPLPPQTPTTEPFFPTDLSFSDSDSDSDLPPSCTPLSKSSPAKSPLPPQNPPHTTEPFFPTDLSFSDSDSDSSLTPFSLTMSHSSPPRSSFTLQTPPLSTASFFPSRASYSSELLRSGSRKRPLEEPEDAPPGKRPANI